MPDTAPHVVIVTADTVPSGSWTRKIAAVLDAAGARVTIVGLSATGARSVTTAGSVRIIRAPDRGVLRRHEEGRRNGRSTALRTVALRLLAYPSREASLHAAARRTVWERENATEIARLRNRISDWSARRDPLGIVARRLLWARIRGRQRLVVVRRAVHRWRAGNSRRMESSERLQRVERLPVRSRARADWRSELPEAQDLELALGPVLDELEPHAVHACGHLTLGVAERARTRARARLGGRRVPLVYDARDDLGGTWPTGQLRLSAARALEREYVGAADRVLAAWPQIAERLRSEYRLTHAPTVVLDTPLADSQHAGSAATARTNGALPQRRRLLVYTGSLADDSAECAVRVLPSIAALHLAFAVPSLRQGGFSNLVTLADELGCSDRVHVIERPPAWQISEYLGDATLGLPATTAPGDPAATVDSYFEHLQAGLPVVVSRSTPAAVLTARSRVGALYTPGDPDSLATAVRTILADVDHYRDACRELSAAHAWPRQAEAFAGVYRDLLGDPVVRPAKLTMPDERATDAGPVGAACTFNGLLGIGPRNGNGQAWAWAEALKRAYPGVRTEVFTAEFPTGRLDMAFPCDVSIPLRDWKSLDWQLAWASHVLRDFSHLLLEQGLTAVGQLNGRHFFHDLPMLRRHGLSVALVFRGSEIRDPGRHAARERYSPFADPTEELTAVLQAQVDELRPHVEAFDGPTFVTTLDLLDDVPRAAWLPQVLDLEFWGKGPDVFTRGRPVVVHAPSKERMKGSRHVDEVCQPLADRGVIDYRRLRGIPYGRMPAVISAADVVVDQFALGSYGVLALQALATGRLVIGNVAERVRSRVPMPLPVLQADPSDFAAVLEQVLESPEGYRALAREGRRYVRRFHDGSYSARQLAPFLGIPGVGHPEPAVASLAPASPRPK